MHFFKSDFMTRACSISITADTKGNAIGWYIAYVVKSSFSKDRNARVTPQVGHGIPKQNKKGHPMSRAFNKYTKKHIIKITIICFFIFDISITFSLDKSHQIIKIQFTRSLLYRKPINYREYSAATQRQELKYPKSRILKHESVNSPTAQKQ